MDKKPRKNEINDTSPEPKADDFDLSHFSDDEQGLTYGWAKKLGLFIFEIVKVVLISLAIILPIRLFLVQPFYVEGASMEPNFYDKEYLVIDEISYRFKEPLRGEVVIFKNPRDTRIYFIKRVIGLPGETIEVKEGVVYVDGNKLEEEYIANLSEQSNELTTLQAGEYFLMGDNRPNSLDSRVLGPIQGDLLVGKVWFRGWPLDRINTFNLPDYSQ